MTVLQAIGWTLIHFLWEGAAIAVVLAVVLFVLRGSTAQVRYAAGCSALFAMPAAFAITLTMLWPHAIPLPVMAVRPPTALPPSGALPPFVPPAESNALQHLLPWFAAFWLAGVAFFYARALAAWLGACRLRSRGTCTPKAGIEDHLVKLCASMRISAPVRVLESCLTDAPVLVGYLKPVILLPIGCLANLPAAQIECILIHELAHIRRHDYVVNLFQNLVEGLLFYHPAVWWTSRVVREERENCCDDVVVALTGNPQRYAATLAALENHRALTLESAIAATGGNLMKRVRRLLAQPQPSPSSGLPILAGVVLLTTSGALFAAWPAKPVTLEDTTLAKLRTHLAGRYIEPMASPMSRQLQWHAIQAPAMALASAAIQSTDQDSQQEQNPRRKIIDKKWLAADIAYIITDEERSAFIQQEKDMRRQIPTPYRKWLNEDVAYIITDEERGAFQRLQTDEERESFSESFWKQRDPTPGTPENEMKEEHYRRIAYANEHFACSIPGWTTDRGRIYITYGPPDELDDHASGIDSNGRQLSYPFQQWRYRFIDGVGTNVIIEFVDPTGAGEYRMTADPNDKFVAAVTAPRQPIAEQKPGAQAGAATPVQQAVKVFRSDQDSRVTVTVVGGMARISVELPGTAAHVYGQISTSGNKVVGSFDRNVDPSSNEHSLTAELKLGNGAYHLTVVVKDPATGELKRSEIPFQVNFN